MNSNNDCIFCKILKGEIPSKKVYEDAQTLAFHDISPKAPIHLLLIPREHYAGVHEVPESKMEIMKHLFIAASKIVAQEHLADSGYRLVINYGKDSGQLVPHIHLHILAGRTMQWPPG